MLTRTRFLRLVDTLKTDEGLKLSPYVDTEGVWTLGYGHNLNEPITMEAADHILRDDLCRALIDLDKHKPWWVYLPEPAQLGIGNLEFNLGWPRFSKFIKFWEAAESRRYMVMAKEIRNSLYYQQVGARAERIAITFESCVGTSAHV